jgi:nitroreductase
MGMETWDAIRARRNVREFAERAIDDADLERILEAGRRAPSSKNWQPWDFVAVRERATLVELAKVWRFGGSVARSAATVALIGPILEDEVQRGWLQFDHGQALMSMMLEATDLGIGSGHSAVGDQQLLRSLLGVPEDHFAVALMPLGYPRDRPLAPIEHPNRRPFSDVVHDGRW